MRTPGAAGPRELATTSSRPALAAALSPDWPAALFLTRRRQGRRAGLRPALATVLAAVLATVLLAACGPMPPQDPFHLAEAKDALGRGAHWYQRGCHAEAVRFFQNGLEEARLADDVPLIVKSLNALGAARLGQGALSQAASALEQACALSAAEPGRPELDSVLGNLGLLALLAGRAQDAEDFWRQAQAEAQAQGRDQTVYLCNLARLELSAGREAAFRAQAELALAAAQTPGVPAAVRADALNLAAQAALKQGRLDQAETLAQAALALDRESENQTGLAQDLETLADIQGQTGRVAEAALSLDRAFYLRAALGDRAALERTLKRLTQSSRSAGLPKSLAPYLAVWRDPELFDPIRRGCP
ncbi:MAG: hypothetical protein LBU12_00645 [Deltaproteobacteria bacterium]|jgi:tetratricopeptide (TPR) repeat protein|nr:hypothetical protein [Deltaproteobacteria bacterium]